MQNLPPDLPDADETRVALELPDGTVYSVRLTATTYSSNRPCWAAWVTRQNPGGGTARVWERTWLADEATARSIANSYWTQIRNGARP